MKNFSFNKDKDYTFILTNRSYVPYGQIRNISADDVDIKFNMNSSNEISFTVYKKMTLIDGTEYIEPLWDKIDDLKLVYVKEFDEYFQIQVTGTDSLAITKSVSGESLCEAELSQYNLNEIEINTEDDIARDDYVQPTIFYRSLEGYEVGSDDYNKAVNSSLLHRILWGSTKARQYKIKHVDSTLENLQRTFSVDGTSIYDFLMNDVAQELNCLFEFDSTDRSISVYDLNSVCMNDDCSYRNSSDNPNKLRYRGDFVGVCPKCGSKNIKYYGEDTTVFIDKENLTDEIQFSTNSDDLKNCFYLTGGDDDMTAAIINVNPNGTRYLYYVSDLQKEDMSDELVSKLETYDKLYDSYTDTYTNIMSKLYNTIDWELYLDSEMMPGAINPDDRKSVTGDNEIITKPIETASQQISKLSVQNMNYTAVSSISTNTSSSVIESALQNYARVYVNTSRFKIEAITSSIGQPYIQGTYNCIDWTGKFKVTNFSDDKDTATSSEIQLIIYDNYVEFINQKIKKQIALDSAKENGSVYDVLITDDLVKYKSYIQQYGLVRLKSFLDSIKSVEDILIQQGNKAQEVYYDHYHDMLLATENEINTRQAQYDAKVSEEQALVKKKAEIQEILNFEKYLGENLYAEFCSYRREQEYSNENFVSDGLNNTDLLKSAKEFIEQAKTELKKAATVQCSISCKVKNLFALDQFEPFWDKFQIGNWIRIGYDGNVYRLRLIGIEGNLSDFTSLNVDFSSVTQINSIVSDIQTILSQSQSMSSSYSYIAKQSNKGVYANEEVQKVIENGFNAALSMIKSNDHEEITFNSHGITAQSFNDETNDYDPEKLKITHNVLAFTDDDFKTLKTVLGKIMMSDGSYKYGLSAEILIGTFILGKYLTIQNDTNTMRFDNSGFYVTNGVNTFHVNPNDKNKFLCLSNSQGDVLWVDSKGKLHINGEGAGLDISSNTTITGIGDSINGINNSIDGLNDGYNDLSNSLSDEIKNRGDADKKIVSDMSTKISETSEAIKLEASKTYYTQSSATKDFSSYDSKAQSYASSAKDEAIKSANGTTDEKLKNYSTTEEMNAALTVNAEGITQAVSKKYYTIESASSDFSNYDSKAKEYASSAESNANSLTNQKLKNYPTITDAKGYANNAESNANKSTDEKLKFYSTTKEMNAAIELKANGITQSVSETYYTKESASSDFSSADTNAKNYANSALNSANTATNDKLKNYSTTEQMNSTIQQTANGIKQLVSHSQKTWDVSALDQSTLIYGYGAPDIYTYPAGSYSNRTYIDQATGKTYIISNGAWTFKSTLTLITDTLSTRIDQTPKQITLEAISSENPETKNPKITIKAHLKDANGNDMKDSNGNVLTAEASSDIDISGKVSFTDLKEEGTTVINGANIKTGSINCDLLNGGTIKGQRIEGCYGSFTEGFNVDIYKNEDKNGLHVTQGIYDALWRTAIYNSVNETGSSSNATVIEALDDSYNIKVCNDSGIYLTRDTFTSNFNGEYLVTGIGKMAFCSNNPNDDNNISTGVSFVAKGTNLNLYDHSASFYGGNILDLSAKTISLNGTITSGSDKRIKQDIKDLSDDIVDMYMELLPSEYCFKTVPSKKSYGLIAQYTNDVLNKYGYEDTNIVNKVNAENISMYSEYLDDNILYGISYDQFHAFHIKMIQLHQKRIESLEKENKELNEKLESYETRISKLEGQNKQILEKLNSLGISL